MNVSVCLSTPSCLPPSLVTSLSVTSDTELTPESLIQQKLPDTVPGNIAGNQMILWGTGQCWEGETASGEWRAIYSTIKDPERVQIWVDRGWGSQAVRTVRPKVGKGTGAT